MIEDPRIDPPQYKDYDWVWDLTNEEVIELLEAKGVNVFEELRERLIDILENDSL